MFNFGKKLRTKRTEASGRKIPIGTREEWLEHQLAKLQARHSDLRQQYNALYELNQSQARKIDELQGANEIRKVVG